MRATIYPSLNSQNNIKEKPQINLFAKIIELISIEDGAIYTVLTTQSEK